MFALKIRNCSASADLWQTTDADETDEMKANKKLSYCWETVRRESMPRIAEMDVEMTT